MKNSRINKDCHLFQISLNQFHLIFNSMKNKILGDGILTLPIKNCFSLGDLFRAAINIYALRVRNLGKSVNPILDLFLSSRKISIIGTFRLIHGDCGDLVWSCPRGRSIFDKIVKFSRGLSQNVNCLVSLIVSVFQFLTWKFPFLLVGVIFHVWITAIVTITGVLKNMVVLSERIDEETVLREGFYRY